MTSAEASKLLKKLLEQKNVLLSEERRSSVFNAAMGEDVESVRPEYDYAATQAALDHLNEKIRLLKHAINCFNTTQTVGDTGMTIDQVLIRIPQLTEMRERLDAMQSRLPKQRSSVGGIGTITVLDYKYVNYSVGRAKEDFTAASDELRSLQATLGYCELLCEDGI